MPNNNQYHNSQSSLENLRLVSYCPLCNTHYNPGEARILEEKDGAHLIHVTCHKCSSSIVAVIMVGGIGVSSIGLITDLTAPDVLHFKEAFPISDDDVIEAYKLVAGADVIKLLNE